MDELTEEQIAEFMEAFSIFDKEEKGFIMVDDLLAMIGSLGQNPSNEEIQSLLGPHFSEDGRIDFPHFLEIMVAKMRRRDSEEMLKQAFSVFDSEGQGWVSTDELRHVMRVLSEKMTDQEVDDLISKADEDGDGTVNYEEFCRLMAGSKDE